MMTTLTTTLTMTLKLVRRAFAFVAFCSLAHATAPDQKTLPRDFAPFEIGKPLLMEAGSRTDAPIGPVHSLGEWEETEAVMTLWTNPVHVGNLAKRGPVKLLADTESEVGWWKNFLSTNKISDAGVSYFVVPTDSIWVRDYGPWFIVDGKGQFGSVDTIYNRPRPQDDVVPDYIAAVLGIPNFKPGLVHTGGNYYNDGLGNGFSSTLVFDENPSIAKADILKRMLSFLGIERYTTSDLGKKITIEHLDTFGKLVAPDTWVFSKFPSNSRFYQDSERMVALLQTLTSPYGTPYRIFRLNMVADGGSENFRAYINSFISGRALYFAAYGDAVDEEVRKVYQAALPGYEIVATDAQNTRWGDSIHCRSRNLLKRNTVFIFPRVDAMPVAGKSTVVKTTVIPSLGATLQMSPSLFWKTSTQFGTVELKPISGFEYGGEIPAMPQGTQISFWIRATDSKGVTKTHPIAAPEMSIQLQVP